MTAVLEARGVAKSFAGVEVLHGVDFEARSGEIHALVGENGAGKTTLLMMLSGVHAPDRGTVLMSGRPVAFRSPADAQAAGVRTVFQDLSLVPVLSVAENLYLTRSPVRSLGILDRSELRRRAREILGRLGAQVDPDVRVQDLSRSQRQLVEIAKALAADAQVLLLDEPTSSLSEAEASVLSDVLQQLKSQGLAIVIVTHRLSEVFALADRITVLRDGRVAGRFDRQATTPDEVLRHMVGRDISQVSWQDRGEPGPVVLEARDLAAPPRLRGVSFQVRAGEILGVAGLEGSGRTELGLALVGGLRLAGGELLLDGKPVRFHTPADAVRARVAYLPPDRKELGLFPRMTVADNIVTMILRVLARFGIVPSAAVRQVARDYRERLQIRCPSILAPVSALSGGNQQKSLLARLLASDPRVLVVDDPTVGVDTGAKAEIHRILLEQARQGKAVVLISSELLELLALADRVLVMRGGSVAGVLARPDLSEESIVRLAAAS
ncbi:MAG: sugar ABC transporter ATP-binding protein [Clostridia bacterium]|nr:sugar ABC transporter ATP-binding protein [Clostridia bacterium]